MSRFRLVSEPGEVHVEVASRRCSPSQTEWAATHLVAQTIGVDEQARERGLWALSPELDDTRPRVRSAAKIDT